jgi:hypothetical protein
MAASRGLERAARAALDRDDSVTAALIEADDDTPAFKRLVEVLDRHDARRWQFNLLDLVVEVSQQDMERRGERRTYRWPESGDERPLGRVMSLGRARPSGRGRALTPSRRPALPSPESGNVEPLR